MKNINVAVLGVGNCASALVQGVDFYRNAQTDEQIPGINFTSIGGYLPRHIKFVAAFDVDPRKIGRRLSSAIFQSPNCCYEIHRDWSEDFHDTSNPDVQAAPIFDGVADHMKDYPEEQAFRISEDCPSFETFYEERFGGFAFNTEEVEEFANKLRAAKVDVLLNYLPVGSQAATEFWANVCLLAGVSLVNCIPVFIASNPEWAERFYEAGIPMIGDDMRSQFGASIVSAVLQELLFKRGHEVDLHYQDNVGGNTDFLNMQDQSRLKNKKISKENVIAAQNKIAGKEVERDSIHAGPACYFPALGDNKRAHWLIKARGFGGAPVEFTADLSVQDSPNSAGVVIDAIRLVAVAKNLGIAGPVLGASAFTQKTPPIDMSPTLAYDECAAMARGERPSQTWENT